MNMITWNLKLPSVFSVNLNCAANNCKNHRLFFRLSNNPINKSSSFAITHAKRKKNSQLESSVLQPSFIQQVIQDDDDDDFEEDDFLITDDFDDVNRCCIDVCSYYFPPEFIGILCHYPINQGFIVDFVEEEFQDDGENYFEDEYATETAESYAGDGAEGGGILLAGTWWDKEALTIAENVTESFDGDLGIFAFRTLVNATIQVRIEKLSTKSGSPSISDIEAFSEAYRTRLDEAEVAKAIPENITLEVSSPGVERVIRIPQELDRFKERPIYVKYVTEADGSSSENDGVFRLISFDVETECCTWGLADVRINREKAGKGRPMSKKQREWRVTTPFDSIRLARLYSEI